MLSGGEKTRLALATLVISGANVLLLDEPTNNLDPVSREQVLDALRTYAGAIVLVTHDEGAVQALNPDKVILLPDGIEDTWSEDLADLVDAGLSIRTDAQRLGDRSLGRAAARRRAGTIMSIAGIGAASAERGPAADTEGSHGRLEHCGSGQGQADHRGRPDRRSPTTCASGTTAARASARWPSPRSARTASSTGCCRSPAPPCAAAAGPTGTARRRDSARTTNGWVRTQQDGAVLTVTLDRPDQLNAQTPATWAALAQVGASLDDDVRVVVVRGEGRVVLGRPGPQPVQRRAGRATAGSATWAGVPTAEAEDRIAGYQAGFRWLRSPGIVSIAAVQGHAIGAGCQLALACDLRILADDAQLRLPEATLGLVPDLTGTSTLVELVGYSRALEICLTGRAVERRRGARASGWPTSSSRPPSWTPRSPT